MPQGVAAGLRLEDCGADLWNAFVRAHAEAQLSGAPEIQVDYFTRAVESLLGQGDRFDSSLLKLDEVHWTRAVARTDPRHSVVGQHAGVTVLWSRGSAIAGSGPLRRAAVPVLVRRIGFDGPGNWVTWPQDRREAAAC